MASSVAADPPRPGTDDDNGLTDNESATLWSRDDDSAFGGTDAAYEADRSKSAIQQVAAATDLTFTRPPATAATWTRHDHADYQPGDRDKSVYPATATPRDARVIKDAHATVFAAQPSTRVHQTAGDRPLYLAPDGRLFGAVDYRLAVPDDVSTANRSVSWSVRTHEITEVRLLRDSEVIARTGGTHRPTVDYRLEGGDATLTLEADIEVTLRREEVTRRVVTTRPSDTGVDATTSNETTAASPDPGAVSTAPTAASNHLRAAPAGNVPETTPGDRSRTETQPTATTGTAPATDNTSATTNTSAPRATPRTHTETTRNVTVVTEELTVRDSIDATVYDLEAQLRYARYPDGTTAIAAFQTQPWQGIQLGDHGRVRGVWRFYTARDTGWDTMTVATATGQTRRPSDVRPVAVHAYPSELGPLAQPTGDGPTLTRVWGRPYAPPGTLGEHVHVEVLEREYRASYGIAVRTALASPEDVTVRGVVRGVTATLTAPDGGHEQTIRRSDLQLTVLERNASGAVLQVRLRDASTGEPIVLTDPAAQYDHLAGDPRTGYVTVAGQRVRTNQRGTATVTVDEADVYTARYHPESWLTVAPAYVGDTATARWHPLTTLAGWLQLTGTTLQWLVPFGLALYAGLHLGSIFHTPDTL